MIMPLDLPSFLAGFIAASLLGAIAFRLRRRAPAAPGSPRVPTNPMSAQKHYDHLARLELESTKTRYATFTAILSISMLLPALALRPEALGVGPILPGISLSQVVFLLGFLFYWFAVFHYAWHHRHSHAYRRELKKLEERMGIRVYRLRTRHTVGRMKLHFDWAVQMLGVVYGFLTAAYVGWRLFVSAVGVILLLYFIRMLLSVWEPTEPLEDS